MSKLNRILRLITFPGAYLKAFWENIFASLLDIPVISTSFLSSDEAAGHIVHGKTNLSKLALFSVLPGFACVLTGLPLFVFGFVLLGPFGVVPTDGGLVVFIASLIALYFGASIMCNLYPSFFDAKSLLERASKSKSAAAKIIGYPLGLISIIGAYCERWGICALVYIGIPILYFLIYVFSKI